MTAVARVDGVEVFRSPGGLSLDSEGTCSVSFALPPTITTGDGILSFAINDGGAVENASKTLPIILVSVNAEVALESGHLVGGVECGVAVECTTPFGDPADIDGEVIDKATSAVVASVTTLHEGRGYFSFTPVAGKAFAIRVVRPSAVSTLIDLPTVEPHGVAIRFDPNKQKAGGPSIVFTAASPEAVKCAFDVFQREKVVAHLDAAELVASVSRSFDVTLPPSAGGVLRIVAVIGGSTVAERLIFRPPLSSVQCLVEVSPPRSIPFSPGDDVELRIRLTDSLSGKSVKGLVGVSVVDDAVLQMVEPRRWAPRLPAMALLETEVKHLEDSDAYISMTSSSSPARNVPPPIAADLLMLTQRWRQFAYVKNILELKSSIESTILERLMAVYHREIPVARASSSSNTKGVRMAASRSKGGRPAEEDVMLEPLDVVPSPVPDKKKGASELCAPRDAAAEFNEDDGDAAPVGGLPAAPPKADVLEAEMDDDMMGGKKKRFRRQMMRVKSDDDDAQAASFPPVFAHQRRPGWSPSSRTDFAECVYWSGVLHPNPHGVATVKFALSDSITSYRVLVDAVAVDSGSLGTSSDVVLESVKPFFVEAKVPCSAVDGDELAVPILIAKSASLTFAEGSLRAEIVKMEGSLKEIPLVFPPGATRLRANFPIVARKPADIAGAMADLLLRTSGVLPGAKMEDTIERHFSVQLRGFPLKRCFSGILNEKTPMEWFFELPSGAVKESLNMSIDIQGCIVSSLGSAFAGLISEPHGCFEQTSSTSYPMVMAQKYMKTHPNSQNRELIKKADVLIEQSYKRLTSFETPTGGFDWFGSAPGHESLTAYGLCQFAEMSEVYAGVDPKMIARTKKWLLEQRDSAGSFSRKSLALDSFGGAPELTTNAYILFSLARLYGKDAATLLTAERAWLRSRVSGMSKKSADAYVAALWGLLQSFAEEWDDAMSMSGLLGELQLPNGSVSTGVTSITRSSGISLIVETTALAVLLWLRCAARGMSAAEAFSTRAVGFLVSNCSDGRFGSTQGTILALQALVANDDYVRSKATVTWSIMCTVDGNPAMASPLILLPTVSDALRLPLSRAAIDLLASGGKHRVQVFCTGAGLLFEEPVEPPRFSAVMSLRLLVPPSSPKCPLMLETSLSSQVLKEGESTDIIVKVSNTSDVGVPMCVAIVGIPAGLEVRTGKLEELKKAGKIAFYELFGTDVVLYWRSLGPRGEANVRFDAVGAIPGCFEGPASRAYLYYTDEYKTWTAGMAIKVVA